MKVTILMTAIIIGFIAFGQMEIMEEKKARVALEEKAQQLERDKIAAFKQDRVNIIGKLRQALAANDYQAAVDEASPYLMMEDDELLTLNMQARRGLSALSDAKRAKEKQEANKVRTQKLVNELKAIPASDVYKNRNLYAELLEMNPGNKKFKTKHAHYAGKVEEQEAKSRLRKVAFGEKPKASGWDGSYYEVQNYLKTVAHDPGSIEMDGCTQVYHSDNGWLVGCRYRGKNAFGALIRQAQWFTIQRGQVVKVDKSGAYSW